MDDLDIKLQRLNALLEGYGELALALSCSDENSFFLVYAKKMLGDKVFALMADAEIFAAEDKLLCQTIVRGVDIELFFIPTREMHELDFLENTERRCLYCRRYILGTLAKTARRFGAKYVSVALTVDKLAARPGMAECLENLGVVTPLAEAGFTTEDVTAIAARLNMEQPDTGRCMAKRIPHGMPLDSDTLLFLADAEAFLSEYGLRRARVEIVTDGKVRIVLPPGAADPDDEGQAEIVAFMQSRNFEIEQIERG